MTGCRQQGLFSQVCVSSAVPARPSAVAGLSARADCLRAVRRSPLPLLSLSAVGCQMLARQCLQITVQEGRSGQRDTA